MSSVENQYLNLNNSNEEEISSISLQKCIKNIIKEEAFVEYKVDKKEISTGGGNYLGDLYEVDIKGTTIDGEKEINLFVKTIKEASQLEGMISLNDIFTAENYFYRELAKIFEKLQHDAEVPVQERFKMVKAYDETNLETIIMENVAKRGFHTGYRMDVQPLKFAELSIRELAKFHAFSFIIKRKDPDYFKRKLKTMTVPFTFGDKWKKYKRHLIENMIKSLDSEVKDRVNDFIPVFLDKFPAYHRDQSAIICCLCHGDFRTNNILFRKEGEEVQEVIPLDYQFIHYGNPVNDFLFFIVMCADAEFRKNHLEHLKDVYYNTMSRFLKHFDIEAKEVYPREEFEQALKDRYDLSLMIAMCYYPVLFVVEDHIPDLDKNELTTINLPMDPRGMKRFLEVVKEVLG